MDLDNNHISTPGMQGNSTAGIYSEIPQKRKISSPSFFGILFHKKAYQSLVYMLLLFVISIVWFVYSITMFALSIGLLITVLGFPILWVYLRSLPSMLKLQAELAERMTGRRIPPIELLTPTGNIFHQVWQMLNDKRTIGAFAYSLLMMPFAIVYFALDITFLSVGFAFMMTPFYPLVRAILVFNGVPVDDTFLFKWLPVPEFVYYIILAFTGICLIASTLHFIRATSQLDATLLSNILE